ncbi:glycosyltransferase family 31 protein [Hyaloscypha variabilis F]|uniref:Glycosyltransferase family 31 protein n=1 Tax=Hyaloscypha variabilis (strain UAMH 11265 / GT02V1 / F) TaxID=1149755 RepID=A0A2J6QZN5_HYAVF|nr:glycosyltransferase family 31 protein [Hyaloscypha variabilis F]
MLRKSAKSSAFSTIRIAASIFAWFWLWHIYNHYQPSFIGIYYNFRPEEGSDSECEPELFHGVDDILVALRTGASEAPAKLPVHFNTTLRCAPHFTIFSDMEEYIEGHHILNALDEVNPDIVASHPDFDYYHLRQERAELALLLSRPSAGR